MGGMTDRRRRLIKRRALPQWSPPVMGGMTLENAAKLRPVGVAAMEPARNGRDDPLPAGVTTPVISMPQWSPPVMGGMTPPSQRYRCAGPSPQWSPPVMGGMTSRDGYDREGYDPPQWSPPVMGGMTVAVHANPRRDIRAAMEPARNGRDDPYAGSTPATSTTGRNGARP